MPITNVYGDSKNWISFSLRSGVLLEFGRWKQLVETTAHSDTCGGDKMFHSHNQL